MLGESGSKSRALTQYDAKGRRLLWPEIVMASGTSTSQTLESAKQEPEKGRKAKTLPEIAAELERRYRGT
jgi:hypothetical protein